jgi:hypothetical protein
MPMLVKSKLQTHTRSPKAERKTTKVVMQPQPFDHISANDVLWVSDPANEYLGCEGRVRGWVVVFYTTPTRIIADTSNGFGEMKTQTWYRNGRQMGGYGNCLLGSPPSRKL